MQKLIIWYIDGSTYEINNVTEYNIKKYSKPYINSIDKGLKTLDFIIAADIPKNRNYLPLDQVLCVEAVSKDSIELIKNCKYNVVIKREVTTQRRLTKVGNLKKLGVSVTQSKLVKKGSNLKEAINKINVAIILGYGNLNMEEILKYFEVNIYRYEEKIIFESSKPLYKQMQYESHNIFEHDLKLLFKNVDVSFYSLTIWYK